jgi:hypothetical protein
MARPWSARCYGVARQREGSRQNSIGPFELLSTPLCQEQQFARLRSNARGSVTSVQTESRKRCAGSGLMEC